MAGGESVFDEMERLNRRLTELPPGCISRKTINGKIRYYHQWYESGKIRSKYVKEADLSGLEARITERKECEQRLKKLKDGLNPDVGFEGFKTSVIAGAPLLSVFDDIGNLKRRDCYGILESYVRGNEKKVCILYGLRRTGKTTMIGQLIRDMDAEELSRTAYMNAADAGTLRRVYWDLDVLRSKGFRTVFIDEITMLDDFIDGCSALATMYASMGMRIVLSGTDSLGLRFAEDDQLYCRAVTIHMNPIRYREHARLMGTGDIDDFIRMGGTLRKGEMNLECPEDFDADSPFISGRAASRYTDMAIASNIQNSLRNHEGGRCFHRLYELYEAGELTNAINRVVEDINHRFALKAIQQEYGSQNLRYALLNDPGAIPDSLDLEEVVGRVMNALSIKDPKSLSIRLDEGHVALIRSYLRALDLIADCDVIVFAEGRAEHDTATVFLQPGMRYVQAQVLVRSLEMDEGFLSLGPDERERIGSRILDTVSGRILEEIVLFETRDRLGDGYEVCKVQFPIGGIDMLVRDRRRGVCSLFEVKHSINRSKHQRRHLVDPEKSDAVAKHFGPISGRFVLYRGEDSIEEDGVRYLNVERYLNGLGGTEDELRKVLFPERGQDPDLLFPCFLGCPFPDLFRLPFEHIRSTYDSMQIGRLSFRL